MGKQNQPSSGGLAILGVILVVCIVLAYLMSTIVSSPPPPVEQVLPRATVQGEEADDDMETGNSRLAYEEPATEEPGLPPREGIEALTAQIRGLSEICDALNEYQVSEGGLPDSIHALTGARGFSIPENPFNRSAPSQPVIAGDFSPGGFSYHPYVEEEGGEVKGFILFSYADSPEHGMTIENPSEIISPMIFHPPIEGPLVGVSAAMNEKNEVIDLNQYRTTENGENEE